MTKISLIGLYPISAFDNKNSQVYFDFLTSKTLELDFNSIRNIELCLNFKMTQESPQSDTCSSRYSKISKSIKAVKHFFFRT